MNATRDNRSARDRVFDVVKKAAASIPVRDPSRLADITPESSLVADLGIDSLSMIELAVLIEDDLLLQPISLSAWREAEAQKSGARFTVGSLIDFCLTVPRRPGV